MGDTNQSLLTIQEAAAFLNVHPETLRRWDSSGKLVAVRMNARGDRGYELKNLLRIKFSLSPMVYKNYEIIPWSLGFEMFTDRFGSVSSYIVKRNDVVSGFAFAIAGLDWFAQPDIKEKDLQAKAIEVIKEYINNGQIENGQEFTFRFDSMGFIDEPNASWWKKGGTV